MNWIYLITGAFLVILAGYHKAVFDTLKESFFTSTFRHKNLETWHPDFSSDNKHKPIRWLARWLMLYTFGMYLKKTLFVWTTDAYNRFKMYYYVCGNVGWLLVGYYSYNLFEWYWVSVIIILVWTQQQWVFEGWNGHFLIDHEEVKERKYMEGLEIRKKLKLDEIDEHDYDAVMKLVDKIKREGI